MEETRRRFLTDAGVIAVGAACGCWLTGCKMISGVGDTPELAPEDYSVDGDELNIARDQVPELSAVGGSAKITRGQRSDPLIIAMESLEPGLADLP